MCDRRGVIVVDKPTILHPGRYEYGEAIVDFDEANTLVWVLTLLVAERWQTGTGQNEKSSGVEGL